jgi:hypothetical protein
MSEDRVEAIDHSKTIALTEEQLIQVRRDNDVTLYWRWPQECASLPPEVREGLGLNGISPKLDQLTRSTCRYEEPVWLQSDAGEPPLAARSIFTRSWGNEWIAGTFRISSRPDNKVPGAQYGRRAWPQIPPNGLVPSDWHAEQLWQWIFPGESDQRRPEGAVIIAGGTGSGKSSLAKAFVFRIMRSLIEAQQNAEKKGTHRGRFPHLITMEDPIEDWSLEEPGTNGEAGPQLFLKYGMCLTARHCPKDVRSLGDAVLDARRQTPACLFVGEIRLKESWAEFLEFAGSGHLIVTTMHAASIREAVARLLAACRAASPAARRQFLGFVKGIVHLRGSSVEGKKVFFPSLWLGNAEAMNSLVSVGLSSVAPNRTFFVGRGRYFARAASLQSFQEIYQQANAFDVAELRSQ